MTTLACFSCFAAPKTPTSRPHLLIDFFGLKLQCLVDTGSTITLVSSKTFRQITPAKRPQKIAGPSIAQTASGKPLRLNGYYRGTVEILNRKQTIVFGVSGDLKGECIIGMDFMKRACLNVDTETNQVYYKYPENNNNCMTAALYTTHETVLQGGRATKVKLATRTASGGKLEQCMGVTSIQTKNMQIANDESLTKTDRFGNLQTYISNLSQEEIRLPRGFKIGVVEKVTTKHPDGCLDEILENLPTATPPSKDSKCSKEKEAFIRQNAKVDHLSPTEKEEFIALLVKNHDIISSDEFDIGNCKTLKHKLHLKTKKPVYTKQFPLPAAHYEEVNRFVDNWLRLGVVKPSYSEYNSPLFLVPKKSPNGKQVWRPVIDLRGINEICYPANYRLNCLEETLQSIGRSQAKFFCSLDLTSGFHQISLTPDSQKLTAFTVPGRGQFCFVRACFGLRNLPLSFMRLMDIVFRNFKPNSHTIFIDDCLLMCRDMKDCVDTCQQAFDRLRAHDLKLNLRKCTWKSQKLDYLGVEISPTGWRNGEGKTKAIKESRPPENVKQIRSWLGLCGFFRASIPGYAQLAGKLSDLTKKTSNWKGGKLPPEALKAFEVMKKMLAERPIMAFPKPTGEYSLFTDASLEGVGAILLQKQEDEETGRKVDRVIAYASKTLEKHQRAYTPYLLELLGMTWGIEHFRSFLLGQKFRIYCDHKPAEKLTKVHTRTFHRLQELLLEYDFDVVYHPGESQIADFLSRPFRAEDNLGEGYNVVEALQTGGNSGPLLHDMEGKILADFQAQDPVTGALLTYLKSKQWPKDTELKKKVTRYAKYCSVHDKVLYIKTKRKNMLPKPCIFAPSMLHAEIIGNAHGRFTTGHGGINNTKERVLTEYFWPNVEQDVEEFVKSCDACQKADRTKESKRLHGPLGKPPTPEAPLEVMHCDLFGPLRTDHGKSHILVMTCPFTKYTRFCAVESKKPECIAEAIMEHWVADFGVPNICVSDAAPDFCSKLSQEIWDMLGVDKRKTSPRHPACNASAEIRNKHIIKYLQTMLEDDRILEWTKLLPMMQLSLNSSHNQAIKMAPFFCLYSVHPRTPFSDPNEPDKKFYGEDFVSEMKMRLEKARQLAKQNNIVYRTKYTAEHDKKIVKYFKVSEGDLVLLHRPELKKVNPKICNDWEGIYCILSLVGQQNALIQHVDTGKTRFVHLDRVKPYISQAHITSEKNATAPKSETEKSEVQTSEKSTAQNIAPSHWVDLSPDIIWLSPPEDIEQHRPIRVPKPEPEDKEEEDAEEKEREVEPAASEAGTSTDGAKSKTPLKVLLGGIGKAAAKVKEKVKESEKRADDFFGPFRPGGQPGIKLEHISPDEFRRRQHDPLARRTLGRPVYDEFGDMLGVDPSDHSTYEPIIISREEYEEARKASQKPASRPSSAFGPTGTRPKTGTSTSGSAPGSSRVTRKGAEKAGIRVPEAGAPPSQPPEYKKKPGRPPKRKE